MASNNLEYTLRLKDLFSKTMQGALVETKKLDDSMNNIKRMASGLFAGIGLVGLGKEILDVGVQFDSIKAGLETLTGSSEKASQVFNQIKKDAASTPFGVGDLATANQMLIGAGANALEARNNVLNLGNAIAATGGGEDAFKRMSANLAQIKSLGKASAADVKQFAFANIPIYKMLSETTGKTVAELKEMDISYEMLTKSFEKAAQKGGMFYGGLEKQSKTVGGQISNLKDNFQSFLYELYENAKPAITFMISALNSLITLIKTLYPLIVAGLTLWGSYYLKMKLATIQSYHFAVANRAMAMGMSKTSIALTWVSRGIRGIGAAIKSVPIVGWIALAIEGLMMLYNKFEAVRGVVYAFVYGIKEAFTSVGSILKGIGYIMIGQFSKGIDTLKGAFSNIGTAAMKGYNDGVNSLKNEKNINSYDLASIGGDSGISGSEKGIKDAKSLGTGTEVTGQRPQSINISIDKLVNELNIQTTNLTEGTAKMKELVSKALLEAVNDINLMAMA